MYTSISQGKERGHPESGVEYEAKKVDIDHDRPFTRVRGNDGIDLKLRTGIVFAADVDAM